MAEKYQQTIEEFLGSNGHELITFVITIVMAVLSAVVDIWDIFVIFKQGTYKKQIKDVMNQIGDSEFGNLFVRILAAILKITFLLVIYLIVAIFVSFFLVPIYPSVLVIHFCRMVPMLWYGYRKTNR